MTIAWLAVRTWGRYAVSLVPLAALALAPWLVLALTAAVPHDAGGVRMQLVTAWLIAATAWIPQVALVASAAPLVRSLRAGRPIGGGSALRGGLPRLVRASAPTLIVALAVTLGTLALVVPGCVLLVLLATANATESPGAPITARLIATTLAARRHPRRAIAVVVTVVVLDLVLALALQLAFVRHLAAAANDGARVHAFLRALALGLVLVSPPCACLLAASRSLDDDAERA